MKKFRYLNILLLAILLIHSMLRDFQLERQFPMDLRNRVVGSRLQNDGKLPYNYYWQPSDGLRYYDLYNWITNGQQVSNITASPFFHSVFHPLFELPQRTVSRIWLCLQYFFLGSMIWLFWQLAASAKEKWRILNLGILFTATEAWIALIHYGQLYLFVAFLMAGIAYALIRNKKWMVVGAGILAAAFVLTRPNAVVFFIPFLFYFKKYSRFLLAALGTLVVYGLFILSSSYEQSLYRNYFHAMQEHAARHMADDSTTMARTHPARVSSLLEGYDMNQVEAFRKKNPIRSESEFGNIFVVCNRITGTKMSLIALNIYFLIVLLALSSLFFIQAGKYPPETIPCLLAGFLFYMVADIFSPVHRAQYNTVQWLPVLFIAILHMKAWRPYYFILFLAGLILNIINTPWIPMRHTLGEYIWAATIFLLIFFYSNKKALPDMRDA